MARRMITRNLKSTEVKATVSYMEEENVVSQEVEFSFEDTELSEPSKIKKLIRKELGNKEMLIQLDNIFYTKSSYEVPIEDFCLISRLYAGGKDKYGTAMQEVKDFVKELEEEP